MANQPSLVGFLSPCLEAFDRDLAQLAEDAQDALELEAVRNHPDMMRAESELLGCAHDMQRPLPATSITLRKWEWESMVSAVGTNCRVMFRSESGHDICMKFYDTVGHFHWYGPIDG